MVTLMSVRVRTVCCVGFLGAFAKKKKKSRKSTICVMSGKPSVCPRGTTRFPHDGF